MLNLNLASKISYGRILNNFQNEAVNQSGVLCMHDEMRGDGGARNRKEHVKEQQTDVKEQ